MFAIIYFMKKITIIILSILFLTSCTIDSPISAVQTFYKQIQAKNYQGACQTMVSPQLQSLDENQIKACIDYYQQNYEQMREFTVENALPLAADKLQTLGADQGFVVYYTAKLNPDVRHEQINVVKVNGKNALVWGE